MKYVQILLLICACCISTAQAADTKLTAPHEFTHAEAADWINSEPLTLAALRGKVVLVEFWAFDCVNCLNSRAWIESLIKDKSGEGLVVVSVHAPELPEEKSSTNVRRAVERLGIHNPVMLDTNHSYWNALHAQYWPTFYLIGRDGLLYGSVPGEMHVGDERAKRVETALNQLLAVKAPG